MTVTVVNCSKLLPCLQVDPHQIKYSAPSDDLRSDPPTHLSRGNSLQEGGAAALAVGLSHIQSLKTLVLRCERPEILFYLACPGIAIIVWCISWTDDDIESSETTK